MKIETQYIRYYVDYFYLNNFCPTFHFVRIVFAKRIYYSLSPFYLSKCIFEE